MISLHMDPCYNGIGFFEVSPTTHWLVELINTCKMVMNFNHLGYWLNIAKDHNENSSINYLYHQPCKQILNLIYILKGGG